MRYSHTFTIQASHFNSERAYETLRKIVAGLADPDEMPDASDVLAMLADIHGHNFRIEVTVENKNFQPQDNWVVDDVVLAKIVMMWDNKNLSVHEDFVRHNFRATTENMVTMLSNKLWNMLPSDSILTVAVWETDSIYAETTTVA